MKEMKEYHIGEVQPRFRNGRKPTETILTLYVTLEYCLRINRTLYLTFLNLNKNFDLVNCELLFKEIIEMEIHWRDIRTIFKLNENNEV